MQVVVIVVVISVVVTFRTGCVSRTLTGTLLSGPMADIN